VLAAMAGWEPAAKQNPARQLVNTAMLSARMGRTIARARKDVKRQGRRRIVVSEDTRVERVRLNVEMPGEVPLARLASPSNAAGTMSGPTNPAYPSPGSNIEPERNLRAAP